MMEGIRNRGGTGNKPFILIKDVLRIARKEDEQDHAFRELRFHCGFFVIVLVFIFLQAQSVARFQTYLTLSQSFEQKSFIRTTANESGELPPLFWIPIPAEEVKRKPPDSFSSSNVTGAASDDSFLYVTESRLTYGQITSEEEFWDWVQQILGQGTMFPQFCQRGFNTISAVDEFYVLKYNDSNNLQERLEYKYPRYCDLAEGFSNWLLDGIRIRQVMVKNTSDPDACSSPLISNGLVSCFPPFSSTYEAKAQQRYGLFKSENNTNSDGLCACPFFSHRQCNTADGLLILPQQRSCLRTFLYFWQQASVLMERSVRGFEVTYPGDGFVVTLPLVNSTWYATVDRIWNYRNGALSMIGDQLVDVNQDGKGKFVQRGATRAIITTMSLYNPNTNLYSYVESVISVEPSGAWVPTMNYFVAPAPMYPKSPVQYATFVFATLTFVYILLVYMRFIRNATVFRNGSCFIILELLAVILYGFVLSWIYTYYFRADVALSIPESAFFAEQVDDPFWVCGNTLTGFHECGGQPPIFAEVGLYAKDFQNMQLIYSVLILLGFIKVFRYLMRFSAFRLINLSLYNARYDLAYFAVIFVVMFIGYALAGYLYYSANLFVYRDFGSSLLTILLAYVRIDVNYVSYVSTNVLAPAFGPIFFFSYFFIFTWVFACVLLAVVYNSWQAVKEVDHRKQLKKDERRLKLERELLLYAQNEVEKAQSVGDPKSLGTICSKMFTDPDYKRGKGRDLLCEKLCFRTRTGWVSKEDVLVRLKIWQLHNKGTYFLDYKTLRRAIAKTGGPAKESVPDDQVRYYFDLLHDRRYNKAEVEQMRERFEMEENLGSEKNSQRNKGPSLSMRKSISTSIGNIAKDNETWLFQIDQHLATMRVHQAQTISQVRGMTAKMKHIQKYTTGYANQD